MEAPVPAGWSARSAPYECPGGTLQRLDGPGGAVGLAVQVRPDLVDHPSVQRGMNEVATFVRNPGVQGVLPLAAWDRRVGSFVYQIRDGVLLSEILADCTRKGIVPGERAAVELLGRVAVLLDAAARAGAAAGVHGHGGLTPWRVVVYPDGEVALLGYALPPVEVLAWLDEETDKPPGDAFRYSPPERIQDDTEDLRSDLFSLGAVAGELALGVPLVSGTASEVIDRLLADEAAEAVQMLSEPVRTLLQHALAAARSERARTGAELARAARRVMRGLAGRTLGALARGAYDERVEALPVALTAPEREDPPSAPDPEPDPEPPPAPAYESRATLMMDTPRAKEARIVIPVPRVGSVSGVVQGAVEDAATQLFERRPNGALFDDEDEDDDDEPAAVLVEPEDDAPPPPPEPELPVEILPFTPAHEPAPEPLAPEPEPVAEAPDEAPVQDWVYVPVEEEDPVVVVADEEPPTAPVEDESSPVLEDDDPGPTYTDDPEVPDVLHLSGVVVDLADRQVLSPDGQVTKLNAAQVAVLGYLAARAGRDVPTQDVWQGALEGHGSPDSVRGFVGRLRKKVERDPSHPEHLLSVPGVGYKLVLPASAPRESGLAGTDRPLLGRDAELEEVRLASMESQLVTIVGPPGSGASQLALHAARLAAQHGLEVHRIVVGGEPVTSAVARALGIRRMGRTEEQIAADLGAALATRSDLLLFLDAPTPDPTLREVMGRWMEGVPAALFLVAYRTPLGVPGERVVRLEPLAHEEAADLFRQRVAEVRAGTQVDDDVASAIAGHLDGMPAALEAAAQRTAFLAPNALLERLDQGQELGELEGDVARTLEQLDPIERSVIEQCVVFREGFDLGAAEAIVDGHGRATITVVESLVAHGLLRIAAGDDTANKRWTMYETARAHLRRTMSPDLLEQVQHRHAGSYGQLGFVLGSRPWVERSELVVLLRERENLRAVLQQGGVEAAGAALGLTAILGYEAPGPLAEAVQRVAADPALEHPDAAVWRAAARVANARLHQHLGFPHRASAELRAVGTTLRPADVLLQLEVARLYTELGSTFEAEAALNRLSSADPWVLAVCAILRGRALASRADPQRAERAFVEALHGFSTLGADVGRAHAQRHFAEILGATTKGRRAVALLESAMAVFEDVGDWPTATQCRMRLAELLIAVGSPEAATAHLEQVIDAAIAASANGLLALARGVLGVVRTLDHDWEAAESLFFLALAGSAPDHKRIQALFALHLLLKGDGDTAHEEARGALPHPVAEALVAALERGPAPENHEAFVLWEALEAWRAAASLARVEAAVAERGSVALRMVLACPRQRPKRAGAGG